MESKLTLTRQAALTHVPIGWAIKTWQDGSRIEGLIETDRHTERQTDQSAFGVGSFFAEVLEGSWGSSSSVPGLYG